MFGKTSKEKPADAELASHILMMRAGMIYQASAGVYAYLPLAWRSLKKIETIIREEMDAINGQEIRMPVVQPQDIWEQSGRYDQMGSLLFRLQDRRDRQLILAPTHEELLTNIVKATVTSYKDLPLVIYQIQTKFRDEARPRGGLIRVREFDMKDAYSFDIDEAGLDQNYKAMIHAYENIYRRCGLDVVMVEADSGAIGGSESHEFILLADSGEDTILVCQGGHYTANAEKATFTKLIPPIFAQENLEEIHTPDAKTIKEITETLGVSASSTIKTVFYMADNELIIVVIRGDLEINEVKLSNALGGVNELRLASREELLAAGQVVGFASPIGSGTTRVISDDSILMGNNFIVGANKPDYHYKNANYERDFESDIIADIASAEGGHPCVVCGQGLIAKKGIEVGHVFKLGTKYSHSFNATFADSNDQPQPMIMGCYGIGIGRLLSSAIEQNHDERGMILPTPIAPYHVSLIALNIERDEISESANCLYQDLIEAGIEVLFDDRQESPGIKFNDADLVGLPIRIVVSPRNVSNNVIELKMRMETDSSMVERGNIVREILNRLDQ